MESDGIRFLVISGQVECKMLPSCAEKHKKPVCTKCDGGTCCTKCCLCKPPNVQVVQGRIDRYQIHPYELVRRITRHLFDEEGMSCISEHPEFAAACLHSA